jgi:DNA-binding NarL/FixJ family response regulator
VGGARRLAEPRRHVFAGTTAEQARACRSLLRLTGSAPPRPGADAVPPALAAQGVTRREADVLALLARGLTNREIATALHLSPRTVEKHVERLMTKTATRRTQLVVLSSGLDRRRPECGSPASSVSRAGDGG